MWQDLDKTLKESSSISQKRLHINYLLMSQGIQVSMGFREISCIKSYSNRVNFSFVSEISQNLLLLELISNIFPRCQAKDLIFFLFIIKGIITVAAKNKGEQMYWMNQDEK